jgi:hypothetical protein
VIKHEVQQGECILDIAERHGLFWETLWNHADNAELKKLREDPNVLFPGDIVNIPEIAAKKEDAAVEKRHRYKRRGVPGKLKFRMMIDGEPRANLAYVLIVDGKSVSGNTDADGFVEADIPADAKDAELRLTEAGNTETYHIQLGSVQPIEEGAEERLEQMGYSVESKDADFDQDFDDGVELDQGDEEVKHKHLLKRANQLEDKDFSKVVSEGLSIFDEKKQVAEDNPKLFTTLFAAYTEAMIKVQTSKESSSLSDEQKAGEVACPPGPLVVSDILARLKKDKPQDPDLKKLRDIIKKAFGQ